MPRKSLIALVLLAAFGFGLLAGAHPCGAMYEGDKGGEKHSRSSSCHEGHERMAKGHGASAAASVPPREEKSPNCCDTFCQHACHMTAVVTAVPLAFAIAPVARTIVEADDPGLALLVQPIDHIPLA